MLTPSQLVATELCSAVAGLVGSKEYSWKAWLKLYIWVRFGEHAGMVLILQKSTSFRHWVQGGTHIYWRHFASCLLVPHIQLIWLQIWQLIKCIFELKWKNNFSKWILHRYEYAVVVRRRLSEANNFIKENLTLFYVVNRVDQF